MNKTFKYYRSKHETFLECILLKDILGIIPASCTFVFILLETSVLSLTWNTWVRTNNSD